MNKGIYLINRLICSLWSSKRRGLGEGDFCKGEPGPWPLPLGLLSGYCEVIPTTLPLHAHHRDAPSYSGPLSNAARIDLWLVFSSIFHSEAKQTPSPALIQAVNEQSLLLAPQMKTIHHRSQVDIKMSRPNDEKSPTHLHAELVSKSVQRSGTSLSEHSPDPPRPPVTSASVLSMVGLTEAISCRKQLNS